MIESDFVPLQLAAADRERWWTNQTPSNSTSPNTYVSKERRCMITDHRRKIQNLNAQPMESSAAILTSKSLEHCIPHHASAEARSKDEGAPVCLLDEDDQPSSDAYHAVCCVQNHVLCSAILLNSFVFYSTTTRCRRFGGGGGRERERVKE